MKLAKQKKNNLEISCYNIPMPPIIAFPLHDKNGRIISLLEKAIPDLKLLFSKCVVGFSPATFELQQEYIEALAKDSFFEIVSNPKDSQIGDHFVSVYKRGAEIVSNNEIIHLTSADRLLFVLLGEHKEEFVADIKESVNFKNPVLYMRSKKAWASHPLKYYAAESALTKVGEILFEKTLDFAWCHLAAPAGDLVEIMPTVKQKDLTILSEMILRLKDKIQTKNVDWLSWEDPFILDIDLEELKNKVEKDDVGKRLSYVVPMLEFLLEQ